jgi:hypothetical protein
VTSGPKSCQTFKHPSNMMTELFIKVPFMFKPLMIFFSLWVAHLPASFAADLLKNIQVVNQGSLGACASVTVATIVEFDLGRPISYLDFAISRSLGRGHLFDLQGSTSRDILDIARRGGACPRELSFFENQANPNDIIGELHSRVQRLVKESRKLTNEERVMLPRIRTLVKEALSKHTSSSLESSREIISKYSFVKYLYEASKRFKSEDWVDGYLDWNFTELVKGNATAAQVIKDLSDSIYKGDPWQDWLRKNVVLSSHARALLTTDLQKRSALISDLRSFSQMFHNPTQASLPEDLRGFRKEVVDWVSATNDFISWFKLTPGQIRGLETLLSLNRNDFLEDIDSYYNLLEDALRDLFRVNCPKDSTQRLSVGIGHTNSYYLQDIKQTMFSWDDVFRYLREIILSEISAGRVVDITYDAGQVLKAKQLPVLTWQTKHSWFLHASVISGTRELPSGKHEYLIHNSYGTDCKIYYDSNKCRDGKIWVSEERLIPYLETVNILKGSRI